MLAQVQLDEQADWRERPGVGPDHVGTIDPNTGLHTGGSETYALSGYVRNKGESDMALTELVRKFDEQQ